MIAAYRNIPQGLRETGSFCLWKYQMRDGRRTKLPYDPNTGRKARSNDQATFADYSTAVAALERSGGRYDGLGIGVFEPLVGIDIDHCIDAAGRISDLALDIIESCGSYAEKSPSGEGVHILLKVSPDFTYEDGRYYIKNPNNGVELYAAGHTNRYLTLTGDRLNDADIKECDEALLQILERYMVRGGTRGNVTDVIRDIVENDTAADEDTALIDDAELLNRMLSSKQGDKIARLWAGEWQDDYTSHSEADLALCNHLAFYCRKDDAQMDRLFRSSGLYREDKWDRKQSGSTYGRITIARAVDDCTEVWTPGYRPVEHGGQEHALRWLQEHDVAHNRRYTHDDIGAGYLLADYMKPFARYVPEKKNWRYFTGVYWGDDTGGKKVAETAKDMSRALTAYAAALHEDKDFQEFIKWAGVWSKASSRRTFIEEASSVHCVSASGFDNDSWLLNLNNGTLDLRTFELHEHNPDDLITQLAPVDYDPAATCPRWDAFIEEIMVPSDDEADSRDKSTVGAEKAAFLQTYLGYCLTGDTSAEAFLVMYGPTSRNGKSVCVEAVRNILGTYSRTVNAETLLQAKRDGRGPSEDIARLCGVRMASVGELPQGSKLDAALIKSLTGGDTLNARYLGENSFDYRPQFKLLLHTNHLPACSDMSVFNSGRAQVLPFSRHFEEREQDRNLKRLFREPQNQSAILNWMIQGLRKYREKGLHAPAAVKAATAEYRKDGDKVARFIEERLRKSYESMERVSLVYAAYKLWCQHEGVYPESSRQFRQRIIGAGIVIANRRPTPGENPTDVIVGYSLCSDFDDLKDAS